MTYKSINIDKDILGGTPVFTGTRVPIQTLFDYLEGGDTLEEFLDDFPTVEKRFAVEVLNLAEKLVTNKNVLDICFKKANILTSYEFLNNEPDIYSISDVQK
jgi:uncharacterized protein (DUF433 family)